MRLSTSAADLERCCFDYGGIQRSTPRGVLLPRSAEEIAELIRRARSQGVPVSARGRGHSAGGQSLADEGYVVDMSTLSQTHECDAGFIECDAGADWHGIIAAASAFGTAPAVLPNHRELSVGGVLSAGGLGETSFRRGLVANAVTDLEVVTGAGDIFQCSPVEHREIFEGVLGGVGQFGIITRVRIKLEPLPPAPRVFRAVYFDLERLFADVRTLADAGPPIIGLAAAVIPNNEEALRAYLGPAFRQLWISRKRYPWLGVIQATSSGDEKRAEEIFSALQFMPTSNIVEARPGFPVSEPVYVAWGFIHPWVGVIVPLDSVLSLLETTLLRQDPASPDAGWVNMYALTPALACPSLFRAPATPLAVFVDYLNRVPASDSAALDDIRLSVSRLYERCERAGAFYYPTGAHRLSRAQWQRHLGDRFEEWRRLKQRLDPDLLLSRGVHEFR